MTENGQSTIVGVYYLERLRYEYIYIIYDNMFGGLDLSWDYIYHERGGVNTWSRIYQINFINVCRFVYNYLVLLRFILKMNKYLCIRLKMEIEKHIVFTAYECN